jgi:hypothetical protein
MKSSWNGLHDAVVASRASMIGKLQASNANQIGEWEGAKPHQALRYPMMAVEDGRGKYDHWGQGEFHRNSHLANYVEGEFL